MTQKFNRNYILTIDPKDGDGLIVIKAPFTMRFWVRRDILSSVNSASIDVFNLSKSNRFRIFQDRNNLGQVFVNGVASGRKSAKLQVGYGNLLYTIWQGDIFTASSAREGVNIITRIESLTAIFDFAASQINLTIAAGTNLSQVFNTLAAQMPTLTIGYISDFSSVVFNRQVVLNGKPWDLIKQYARDIAYAFTDNGKLYIMNAIPLKPGGAIDKLSSGGPVPVFGASTGLLETPRREQTYLSIVTLMEPSVQVNTVVQVDSVVEPSYNGQYAVIGIQHSGVISGAVSGDCRSVFFLSKPEAASYNQVTGT